MSASPKFEAFVFDLDGTLVDAFEDIRRALNEALRPHGFAPLTLEETKRRVGNGLRRLMEDTAGDRLSHLQQVEAMIDFTAYYREHIADNTRPYPGIEDVLKSARAAGVKMAVISNKPDRLTTGILRRLKMKKFFDQVWGQRPDWPQKPDPEIIRRVLRELDVAPQRALVIGDGETDMAAGKGAGARVAACLYGARARSQLAPYEPDFWIENPRDLLALIPRR